MLKLMCMVSDGSVYSPTKKYNINSMGKTDL